MDKNKGMKSTRFYVLMSFLVTCIIAEVLLYAFSVFSLFAFLISLSFSVIFLSITILLFSLNKKRKIEKVDLKGEKIVITDKDIIDLYNKTGIPIIYDKDGKLKNIFELLGIDETYDNEGNRLMTIYEQLGIVPRFSKKGKEVPTFLIIKNRVNALIKPEKKTGVLTRSLSDKEKEDLLLKQMLAQKLEEAQKEGDKKKEKAIKKIVTQKKKEEEKKSKSSGYLVLGKGAKGVSISSGKPAEYKNDFSKIFSFGGNKPKYSPPSPSETKESDSVRNKSGYVVQGTEPISKEQNVTPAKQPKQSIQKSKIANIEKKSQPKQITSGSLNPNSTKSSPVNKPKDNSVSVIVKVQPVIQVNFATSLMEEDFDDLVVETKPVTKPNKQLDPEEIVEDDFWVST